MQKITIETGGVETQVTVDGKTATFGPAAPGGGTGTPGPKPDANPITGNPGAQQDLGTGDAGTTAIVGVATNVPVGVSFRIRDEARNQRQIRAEGHPGQFWDHNSWAIYEKTTGNKQSGLDNQVVVGTLGYTIGSDVLMKLGAGDYILAFNVNAPGSLAFVFVQS